MGKVFLFLVVGSAMIYGGYYFGKQTKGILKIEALKTQSSYPSPTATPKLSLKVISGGVAKTAGLSFDQYVIQVPIDWESKKENQTAMDEKLILTKGGYQISIFQAATGGALCLYKNDPDFEGPSSRFTFFKELQTEDQRIIRRSGEENGVSFTICQQGSDGSFGQPTNYGHISIKLPNDWDQKTLDEIDKILSSIKKI